MPLLGYSLAKEDNGSFAFGGREDLARCPGCLHLVDKWNVRLTGLRLKLRQFDLSCTYDGVTVSSARFRTFVESKKVRGVEFCSLPDDPAFSQVNVFRSVRFDSKRRETVFEDQCPVCHRFDAVAGATPAYLVAGEVVDHMEIVRTDVEFGTGDEQCPVLICGIQVADLLRACRFRGFYLKEVAE